MVVSFVMVNAPPTETPLKVTSVAGSVWKFCPVIVTWLPTCPLVGVKLVTVDWKGTMAGTQTRSSGGVRPSLLLNCALSDEPLCRPKL